MSTRNVPAAGCHSHKLVTRAPTSVRKVHGIPTRHDALIACKHHSLLHHFQTVWRLLNRC
jgi:hypothetical protein